MPLRRSLSAASSSKSYKSKYRQAKEQAQVLRDQCSMLRAAYNSERNKREQLEAQLARLPKRMPSRL